MAGLSSIHLPYLGPVPYRGPAIAPHPSKRRPPPEAFEFLNIRLSGNLASGFTFICLESPNVNGCRLLCPNHSARWFVNAPLALSPGAV
jgi:hypothetical protein